MECVLTETQFLTLQVLGYSYNFTEARCVSHFCLPSTVHKLQCSLLGAWGGSCLKKLRGVIKYSGLCGGPDVLKDPLQSLFLGCCGTLHVYIIRSLADNSNNSCVCRQTTQTIPQFMGCIKMAWLVETFAY